MGQRAPVTTIRRGFTLVELLVVIAIIGVLVCLLLPAVQSSREAARRTQCQNHLKQFGLAFHQHHDSLQFFPTGGWDWITPPKYVNGTPATGRAQQAGWGFQLLPYIEQTAVWNGGGAATDIDKAVFAIGATTRVFFCPARRPPQTVTYSYPGYLNGLEAKHALCDYSASSLDGYGVVRQYDPRRMAEITDGTSHTFLVGDKRLNRAHLGQAQADDNEGYTCGWNEDTVRLTSQRPQPDFIGDPSLFGGKLFGSSHPAQFNMTFADGSVRSLSYQIELSTFQSLGNVGDGQTVSLDAL
jgi:prepilin-type N-terminal cleavage/methylation domain-containing protein/prepilin-type processing-associated H-X9-DG protein